MSLDSNAGLVSAPLWSKIASLELACMCLDHSRLPYMGGVDLSLTGGYCGSLGAGDDHLPYNEVKTCITALARE